MHWIRFFLTPGKADRWDAGYLMWFMLCGEYIYKSWTGTAFDLMNFGAGAAALLGAGAALQLRANHDQD